MWGDHHKNAMWDMKRLRNVSVYLIKDVISIGTVYTDSNSSQKVLIQTPNIVHFIKGVWIMSQCKSNFIQIDSLGNIKTKGQAVTPSVSLQIGVDSRCVSVQSSDGTSLRAWG